VRTAGAGSPSLEIPKASWFNEDVVEAFRRDAVREAGTMMLDGREYTKLVTEDGLNAILVDPDTGEPAAWIPSPEAFGVPTTVVRSRETLPDDAASRRTFRSSTCTQTRPSARSRQPSSRAIAAQYPRA
jgi:hypothetical protein